MSPLRVVVADDDRTMRELLSRMLDRLGYEVVAMADSGEALIEKCVQTKPDIIITDNLMPGLDGADAAAIIYARRPIPIILLSAFCDRDMVLEAERKHVLIYLVKPIGEDNLRVALERCRTLLSQSERAQEVDEGIASESRFEEPPGRSPRTSPYLQSIRPSHYTLRD